MLIIVITLDEHGKFLDMEQMTAEIFDHHYDFDFYEAAPEYVFQNEDLVAFSDIYAADLWLYAHRRTLGMTPKQFDELTGKVSKAFEDERNVDA